MSRLRVIDLANARIGPLSVDIRAGECVCLYGPSGSGKTTLLRVIADLETHDGRVLLDNAEPTSFRGSEWRRRVGMLPAESAWWRDRVGDHFEVIDEQALAQLGFAPDIVDRKVARLSTGERQRLALLRLLAGRPRALLLDEPTASLDPKNTRRAEQLVTQYRQQQRAPVLWVSHDPRQMKRVCDRRLHLLAGQLQSDK